MKIITEAAISAAEDQAQAAERELAVAEAPLVRSGGRVDQETAAQLAVLQIRARHTRANVTELTATRAEQQRALQARAEREQKAAPAIGSAVTELEASRTRLVAAVTAGDLPTAGKAAMAHDALVVRVRELLSSAGLRLHDVADDCDHATGVDDSPTGTGVRLRGRYWGRLDAGAVLGWLTWRTAASLLGRQVADRLVPAGARQLQRSGDLLEGVPDLPAFVEPSRWSPPSRPRDAMVVGRVKPYLEREDRRPEPTPGWEQRFAREFGRPYPGGDAA